MLSAPLSFRAGVPKLLVTCSTHLLIHISLTPPHTALSNIHTKKHGPLILCPLPHSLWRGDLALSSGGHVFWVLASQQQSSLHAGRGIPESSGLAGADGHFTSELGCPCSSGAGSGPRLFKIPSSAVAWSARVYHAQQGPTLLLGVLVLGGGE